MHSKHYADSLRDSISRKLRRSSAALRGVRWHSHNVYELGYQSTCICFIDVRTYEKVYMKNLSRVFCLIMAIECCTYLPPGRSYMKRIHFGSHSIDTLWKVNNRLFIIHRSIIVRRQPCYCYLPLIIRPFLPDHTVQPCEPRQIPPYFDIDINTY